MMRAKIYVALAMSVLACGTRCPAQDTGKLTISGQGLADDSPKSFTVYKGAQYWAKGTIGKTLTIATGTYRVQVGFPSGWLEQEVAVAKGQTVTIPTGLFRFQDLVVPGMLGAMPQKLYAGETYLATGYAGQTARLLPGTYQVYFHGPWQERPAQLIVDWHWIGPFPATGNASQYMDLVFPPEQRTAFDFASPIKSGTKTYPWSGLTADLYTDLARSLTGSGIVYLVAELQSQTAQDIGLIVQFRGGIKVWLNGQQIHHTPHSSSRTNARHEVFTRLQAGNNTLLVKVYATGTSTSPMTVVREDWYNYQVQVHEGLDPVVKGLDMALAEVGTALGAVPGIGGIVFCQVPDKTDGTAGLYYEQFRIVRRPERAILWSLIPASPYGVLTDLTGTRLVAAMHPDLSYDATKILLSGKETSASKWAIYEMGLDGSDLHRITDGSFNCIDPYYLPNGRIVFSGDKAGFRDEYDRDIPPLLFKCKTDGTDLDQISFNLSSDTASIVLSDGRILLTSWQHHGEHLGVAGSFDFFFILPDGTGFNPYALYQPGMSKTKSYAQQLTDGRVVFVESAGHRHYNAGALAQVHPRNPHVTRQVLTPDMVFNGVNLGGRYASPYPMPDGGMLCAYSPGRATSPYEQDPSEQIHEGIYVFDFQSGKPGRLIFDDPGSQDYDPIAIYTRPVPPIIPSMVNKAKRTGTLTCANAYLSDRPLDQKQVVVGALPPAAPGQIKSLRVVEGFGVLDTDPNKHKKTVIDMLQMSFGSSSNGGNSFEQKRIIGYAPVQTDGSFSIEVPADTTLFVQTLDENNMAIETQLTWVWVRPGETRMCVGCHEARDSALMNQDCLAMRTKAHLVAAEPVDRRTVDFRRDIMPVIERRCSSCHDANDPAGGLGLRPGFDLVFHRKGVTGETINAALFNHAYESLLQAPSNRIGTLVIPSAARHSPLIWRLYGRQMAYTDSRNPYTKPVRLMPPGSPLSEMEKQLFVEWVDLGAQWDNIPGEDDLPGYNGTESARLAKLAEEELKKPILDPKLAFDIRCLECHDMSTMDVLKQIPNEDIQGLVDHMSAKRNGWILPEEIPLIVPYVQQLKASRK